MSSQQSPEIGVPVPRPSARPSSHESTVGGALLGVPLQRPSSSQRPVTQAQQQPPHQQPQQQFQRNQHASYTARPRHKDDFGAASHYRHQQQQHHQQQQQQQQQQHRGDHRTYNAHHHDQYHHQSQHHRVDERRLGTATATTSATANNDASATTTTTSIATTSSANERAAAARARLQAETQALPSGAALYSREAINAALGPDPAREEAEKQRWCAFICDLALALAMPQLTIATATVFFHRFYMQVDNRLCDKFTMATACLFLAGKVEETPKRLQQVLLKAHALRRSAAGEPPTFELTPQHPEYQRLQAEVLQGERFVLQSMAFDLTVTHPYKFLLQTVKAIASIDVLPQARAASSPTAPTTSDGQALRKLLAQNAWNFVNDSLRTTLCLQFEPRVIALAAIDLAAQLSHLQLTVTGASGARWYERLAPPVAADAIDAVKKQMLALYEGPGLQNQFAATVARAALDASHSKTPSATGAAVAVASSATSPTTATTTATTTSDANGDGDVVAGSNGSRKRASDDTGQPSPVRAKLSPPSLAAGGRAPPPPPIVLSQPPPPPPPPTTTTTTTTTAAAATTTTSSPTTVTTLTTLTNATTSESGRLSVPVAAAAPASPRSEPEHSRPALQSPTSGMSPATTSTTTLASTMATRTSVALGVALPGNGRANKATDDVVDILNDLDDAHQDARIAMRGRERVRNHSPSVRQAPY